MQAPKCRVCGAVGWGHVCGRAASGKLDEILARMGRPKAAKVAEPVTDKPVALGTAVRDKPCVSGVARQRSWRARHLEAARLAERDRKRAARAKLKVPA